MDIRKLIAETYEKENPSLCAAIKQAVQQGETKANFERFAKRVLGSDQSMTFNLSMTLFEYYSQLK